MQSRVNYLKKQRHDTNLNTKRAARSLRDLQYSRAQTKAKLERRKYLKGKSEEYYKMNRTLVQIRRAQKNQKEEQNRYKRNYKDQTVLAAKLKSLQNQQHVMLRQRSAQQINQSLATAQKQLEQVQRDKHMARQRKARVAFQTEKLARLRLMEHWKNSQQAELSQIQLMQLLLHDMVQDARDVKKSAQAKLTFN